MDEVVTTSTAPDDAARGIFDGLKHTTPNGAPYWLARELQDFLGYETLENFKDAIVRATEACAASNIDVSHQFRDVTDLMNVVRGAGVRQPIP